MVEVYPGLNVSDKLTHGCVVDDSGEAIWTEICARNPKAIAGVSKRRRRGQESQLAGMDYGDGALITNLNPRRLGVFGQQVLMHCHRNLKLSTKSRA